MKIIKEICRILVGIIFIFSGFVKAIDPIGSMYKFADYFDAFHLSFLNNMALPFAILLNIAELTIGILLFVKIRIRFAAWALVFFMSFFTILTFILAVFNPVSDCGCFGDALIMTNWQTFFKNILIFAITIVVFWKRNEYKTVFPNDIQAILAVLTLFIGVYISFHALNHIPVLDFRPYKVGVNITEAMNIPEDAPFDEYETYLFYEKDGETKKFSMENYPAEDTSWTFVNQESVLIKKGYEPPIHDFSILNEYQEDYTDNILSYEGYTFIMVSKDITKLKEKYLEKVYNLYNFSVSNQMRFIWLTASNQEQISQFKKEHNLVSDFYNGDETTIKTIVRANPGVLLLKEGTIIGKWHINDAPVPEELKENLMSTVITNIMALKERQFVLILIFFFLATMLSFKQFIKVRLKP